MRTAKTIEHASGSAEITPVARGRGLRRLIDGMLFWPAVAGVMAYTAWTIASFWQFTVDDAYISGRFARNLAHDLTLSWNPGLPATEGYTNFLYVLLMAAADRLTIDPVLAGKAIGVACTFAILVYLIVLGQRVFGSRWAGLVGAAVFAAYGATPVHAVSGLETMFYTLLLLALADVGRRLWCCDPERSGRHAVCLGLLGLAAAWTRPEGVGVFLAVAAVVLGSRRALFNRKTLRALLLTFFLPGLVYMGWRLWYFGYLFPNTFYHKVSSSGMDAALQYFRAFALSLGPLVLLVVALGFRWQRAFLAPVVVVLAALPIYLWTNVSNMGYAYRFVYPALVLVALLVTAASGNLLRALRSVSGKGGLAEPLRAAVLILLLTPQLSRDGDAHQRYYISRYSPGLRSAHVAVGKLLQSVSPTGRLVVWSDAGAIPYFSGWIALDAGGLVDRQIAHHGLSNEYLFAFMPDAIVMTENTPYLANDKGQWKCDQLSAHPAWREYARLGSFAFSNDYAQGIYARPGAFDGALRRALEESPYNVAFQPFASRGEVPVTISVLAVGPPEIEFRFPDKNPTKGDVAGVGRVYSTVPGQSYRLELALHDGYSNDRFPGIIHQRVTVDGVVVHDYDVAAPGGQDGWRTNDATFEATASETDVRVFLEAVGTVPPWSWGTAARTRLRALRLAPI